MAGRTSKKRKLKHKKRRPRSRLLPVLLVIGVILLAGAAGMLLLRNSPARRYERQMASGERYFEEGSYAQAAIAYEAALDIDTTSADAYAALVSAYGSDFNATGVADAYNRAQDALSAADAETVRMTASAHLTQIAERYLAAADYDSARELVTALKEVDEASAYRIADLVIEATAPSTGSVISFGSYLGASLEWTVLRRDGDKILLLCNQLVESMPFTETQIGVAWEYSTLRRFLATEFLNAAFSVVEQTRVAEMPIDNPKNPDDNATVDRKATYDRVHILSMQEIAAYFPEVPDRVMPSAYWTRTSALRSETGAVCVTVSGTFETADVRDAVLGVRPAIWLVLE